MAAKKKPDIIPKVDIIKAGISFEKPYEVNSDGLISISRNKKVDKIIEKNTVSELLEKEKELKLIQEKLNEMNLKKDDIKDIKDDIKKGKKKKKKKNKKKKDSGDTYMTSMLDAVPDDLAEYIRNGGKKGEKKKKKKDKEKKKNRSKIEGLTVKEKKKDKSSNKKKSLKDDKNKSEVAQRFKEVERITRDNIKEIDETMAVVDERIKDIVKSSERVRGKDKALADYIAAKTSLISSRQKAATDILSNRAKVYDIEMKKEKESAGSSLNDADLIAKIFPGIALNSAMSDKIDEHIGKSGKNKDNKKKKKDKKRDDFYYDAEEDFLKREKDLIDSGEIEYSKYDQNIEYEGQFDVAVKKSFQTGEWKFVAINDDGKFLKDVPKSMLPSKKTASMKFDDENDTALDVNSNKMYRVFSVPQI